MGLIDSHAHLTSQPLADAVPEYLDQAVAAGVDHVISIGVDIADAENVIELARGDDRVSAAFGIHPHEAGKVSDDDWTRYECLLSDPSVVALGEMGLDYHYDFADRATQRSVFERQIEIASTRNLPVIIHSREAHQDTIAMLEAGGCVGRQIVFHCFTGTEAEAAEIADNGWRISFTGVVTFKNALELQRIAVAYPLDRLMIETDSPYLSPAPVRHVRPNQPAHVAHIAAFLSKLRDIPYEDLVEKTADNTRAFFNIPSPGGASPPV